MRVALLIRGIMFKLNHKHFTNNMYTIDYKLNYDNLYKKIIEPLRELYDVDIFIASYKNEKYTDQDILTDFSPKSYILIEEELQQVDCIQKGLELIRNKSENENTTYDFIIVTRFDLDLKINITNIPFKIDNFNFIWYELSKDNLVGDCMFFLAGKFLDQFIKATQICEQRAVAHFIKNYIDRFVQPSDINIIYGFQWSNSDTYENPLYKIVRGELRGQYILNPSAKILGLSKFGKFKIPIYKK